jgi:hypothetical protein
MENRKLPLSRNVFNGNFYKQLEKSINNVSTLAPCSVNEDPSLERGKILVHNTRETSFVNVCMDGQLIVMK